VSRGPALCVALCYASAGLTRAEAQPARPAACSTAAQPGEQWTSFVLRGLRLQLALPPELRPLAEPKLRKTAERAAERSLPANSDAATRLVAAWEAPARSASELRQVLLYTVQEAVPRGRPCALLIAQQPGLVFKLVLSGQGRIASEYWTEAHWPGFVLAVGGRSLEAYELGFAILRSITVQP
jgi:hypothetical protein